MTFFFIHITIHYDYISKIFYSLNKIFYSLDFFIIYCTIFKIKQVSIIRKKLNVKKGNSWQFFKMCGYLYTKLFKNRSLFIFYFIQCSHEITFYFNRLCLMLSARA